MSSNPLEKSDFETKGEVENLDGYPVMAESGANAAQGSFPFEAMNLKVGDRLQAQPPKKVSAERCFVRLIGYCQDLSLLLTTPATANNVRLQLMEGDQLIMRVFSSQNAFGFACDVQRVCKLPYNYLHVSFPKEVQGTVIRKEARVKTKIIVNIRAAPENGKNLTGIISNLSANGALIDGPRKLAEPGETIRLTFRLTLRSIEASLSLLAVVRAAFDDEKLKQSGTSLTHFGVEFVGLVAND
ncbi:flagellar brake protein [Rhodoferax sp. PAMC 29310]|uniref:flagellar brake protein n=1 Tax=Rhodoferax sp. PAMC 29310 TaxID=2822760 RepID=UPI001B31AB25|nr:flagellar brake protein [Rhodoferax sp. PAMC 29310]